MRNIDYEERAAECSRQAEYAPNENARGLWKRMAEFWRERAGRPAANRTFQDLKNVGSPPTAPRK
jgi:hypothetical protein